MNIVNTYVYIIIAFWLYRCIELHNRLCYTTAETDERTPQSLPTADEQYASRRCRK